MKSFIDGLAQLFYIFVVCPLMANWIYDWIMGEKHEEQR